MSDDKRWRKILKRVRKEKGLTLDQLSRLTEISKSQISMLESGERPFTQKILGPIVDELGIDFADLFCGCSFHKRRNDPANLDPRHLRESTKVIRIKHPR